MSSSNGTNTTIEQLFDKAYLKQQKGYNSQEKWRAQKEAVREWLQQKQQILRNHLGTLPTKEQKRTVIYEQVLWYQELLEELNTT